MIDTSTFLSFSLLSKTSSQNKSAFSSFLQAILSHHYTIRVLKKGEKANNHYYTLIIHFNKILTYELVFTSKYKL